MEFKREILEDDPARHPKAYGLTWIKSWDPALEYGRSSFEAAR